MKVRSLHQIYFQPIKYRTIGFTEEGVYSVGCAVIQKIDNKKPVYGLMEMGQYRSRNQNVDKTSLTHFQTETYPNFSIPDFSFNTITILKSSSVLVFLKLKQIQARKHSNCGWFWSYISGAMRKIRKVVMKVPRESIKVWNQLGEESQKIYVRVTINDYDEVKPYTLYKKINFMARKFYSTLNFTLFHVRTGYRVRKHLYNLLYFTQLKDNSRHTLLQKTKAAKQKNLKIDFFSLFHCEKYEDLYKVLIRRQIEQCVQLHILREVLLEDKQYKKCRDSSQNSPHKEKNSQNNSKISLNYHFDFEEKYISSFEDIEKQEPVTKQKLMKWYEADQEYDLQLTLYSQSQVLSLQILQIWMEVIRIVAKKERPDGIEQATNFQNIKVIQQVAKFYTVNEEKFPFSRPESQIRHFLNITSKYVPTILTSFPFISIQKRGNPQMPFNHPHTSILFILAHGLKGSEGDMNHIKNHIQNYKARNSEFLILKNIKYDDQNQSLQQMGKKAADQILLHIKTNCYQFDRINMIGFSMGGLVLRAALKYLTQYKDLMNLFMSLSTPHLGMIPTENCLLNFGLFCLRKIKGFRAVDEIYKGRESSYSQFMKNLPKGHQISWFEFVVVVGSRRDPYIRSQSALLSYQGSDEQIKALQNSVVDHVNSIHRVSVDQQTFDEGLIDKCYGKNHTYFIVDDPFLYLLISKYMDYF